LRLRVSGLQQARFSRTHCGNRHLKFQLRLGHHPVIFLIAGKLDFTAINPHASQPT